MVCGVNKALSDCKPIGIVGPDIVAELFIAAVVAFCKMLKSILYLSCLGSAVLALPSPVENVRVERAAVIQAIPANIIKQSQLDNVLAGLKGDAKELTLGASALADVISAIVPGPSPDDIASEISSVASVYKANPTAFFENAATLVLNGLAPKGLINDYIAETSIVNSDKNYNPRAASPAVYPKKSPLDAPYSVDENTLRSALYIPKEFSYGKVRPCIFVPGTGATAGSNFLPNLGKIFTGSDYADPVYLNIPKFQLDDIQINAEFVAYAINYISAISGGKNVSVVSWSAGSIDTVWAHQYWPSTIGVTSDLVSISGDRHGTVLAYLLSPAFPKVPSTPAIIQQQYNSKFIQTLRNGGGASAYVPTTSIYSIFDEIVQPQAGPNASAFVRDDRNVGATNIEIQETCTVLQPGGTLYTHEGVLYNALAVAATIDALTHEGPADLKRIDMPMVCQEIADPRLSIVDVLATEALIPIAALEIAAYNPKIFEEPPIKPYAQKDVPRA
ncbi:related to lipase B precursor [Rhynchosporium graminicola]|uniref:Related to lipase B n=1 Tax=Rhynchosporium graminicola TaxID=2792576 RepID=A0A1E1K3W1_9HELO|nr:related to lipase B precursor [Rhynchosporium commune]